MQNIIRRLVLCHIKNIEGISLEIRKIDVPLHATSWRVARDFLDTRWLDMATYAFSSETKTCHIQEAGLCFVSCRTRYEFHGPCIIADCYTS